MKLRNKKTGEIFDALIREKGGGGSYSHIVCDIKAYEPSKSILNATQFVLGEYNTLTELNENWEDYKPAEPLIKDEKIRKAVRAWAEANGVDTSGLRVSKGSNNTAIVGWIKGRVGGLSIDFETHQVEELEDGKKYTIEELCGEEAE